MSLGVVVPYREADPYRAASVERVERHLRNIWGDRATYVRADDGGAPFSRGGSLAAGVAELGDVDVVLVCDADLLVPAAQLLEAVELAGDGDGLVIPFRRYLYLTPKASRVLTSSLALTLPVNPRAQWAMEGSLGGCGAMSRRTVELAGGWPPVFRGWGMEDVAFELLADELAGPTRRVAGDALHLFHPVDPTNDPESPGYRRNVAALQRLIAARVRGRAELERELAELEAEAAA